MTWDGALLLLSLGGYFGLAVLGWAIGGLARRTLRYHPAVSFAGLAIGLIPTWFFLVILLRRFGLIVPTQDLTQRLATTIVVLATVYAGVQVLRHVRRAIREEGEQFARAAGGC